MKKMIKAQSLIAFTKHEVLNPRSKLGVAVEIRKALFGAKVTSKDYAQMRAMPDEFWEGIVFGRMSGMGVSAHLTHQKPQRKGAA